MNFYIGLSALRSNQIAIDTIAQNLANANNDDYHRRSVSLQTAPPQQIYGRWMGAGVEVGDIGRLRSQILENSITSTISDLQHVDQRLTVERQIESLLLPGDGSIHDSLSRYFDEISKLAANPGEFVQRSAVIRQGQNLADQVRTIQNRLVESKGRVRQQVQLEVDTLNREIESLVDLQNQIKVASVNGTPNELYDRRDELINKIAEKVDVYRFESSQGGFGLSLAGNSIALNDVPIRFEMVDNPDGTISVRIANTERTLDNGLGGRLSALTSVYNETLPKYLDDINRFAGAMIREMNQAHATGVGLSGPYTVLKGTRAVSDLDVPLAQADTDFPIENGKLFFSITDPNGEKITREIAIDPATESLRDVAAKISALDGVQAVLNDETRRMSIVATPGYRFDFTGNMETIPDLSQFTGTSTPRLAGNYRGDSNTQLTVNIVGTGTIGLTEGLTAQAIDETGEVVAEINIGKGYEPGSTVDLLNGVEVNFAYGDVNDGNRFVADLVANSDETGILSALGINSFFDGKDASDMAVENRLVKDPNQFAAARSGNNGDTLNLQTMVGLRDKPVLDSQNFEDFLGDSVSEIGFQIRISESVKANIEELQFQYEAERVAISGVDLNEEMLNLSNFQKAYEASVQVVRTVEAMMDELFTIIR